MSPENNSPPKPTTKDDGSQGSGGRKTASARPPEPGLKCPRCDSPNTKFCYYNNYSLTQPRHFCKTCRRYWTKGGALRNVPIGGGCRKNKKVKSSSSSRLSGDSKDISGFPSELGGFKFFHGLSPSMDFHLGGPSPFPRFHHHHPTTIYNQISSFENVQAGLFDPSGTSNSMINFNYPSAGAGFSGVIQGVSSMNVNSNLASSIESLSSANQDLHWKLQQQRLAMLFGGDDNMNNQKAEDGVHVNSAVALENQTQKPQPILFHNLEISKPEINCAIGDSSRKEDSAPTEWFFGNSFSSMTPTPTSTSGTGGNNGHDNASNNWSTGFHAWGDMQQQYNALP